MRRKFGFSPERALWMRSSRYPRRQLGGNVYRLSASRIAKSKSSSCCLLVVGLEATFSLCIALSFCWWFCFLHFDEQNFLWVRPASFAPQRRHMCVMSFLELRLRRKRRRYILFTGRNLMVSSGRLNVWTKRRYRPMVQPNVGHYVLSPLDSFK